ncbi:MAG: iron-containing alcohol dehydrogenase [Fimbriimonadales bacterium]
MSTHPIERVRWVSVSSLDGRLTEATLVADPIVWRKVQPVLHSTPAQTIAATTLDESALETLVANTTPTAWVIGLGGGTAIDTAKYLAWRWEVPLQLVPSALTVDAPFTDSVAVRRDGRIHYTGRVVPEFVLIDTDLIRSAPPHLNRGGVGDLLSIHTALYDWQLAHQHTGEAYDADIARQSADILNQLQLEASEILSVSERGVHRLVELFCEEVWLCEQVRSSRPEEGSEHHVLYTLEYQTGRTYLHGSAVTLCALLVAYLQENRPEPLRHLADACGVDYASLLKEIGSPALRQALLAAPEYARQDRLPPTFLTLTDAITEERVDKALYWLTR